MSNTITEYEKTIQTLYNIDVGRTTWSQNMRQLLAYTKDLELKLEKFDATSKNS